MNLRFVPLSGVVGESVLLGGAAGERDSFPVARRNSPETDSLKLCCSGSLCLAREGEFGTGVSFRVRVGLGGTTECRIGVSWLEYSSKALCLSRRYSSSLCD